MGFKELTLAEKVVMKCIWSVDYEMSMSEILKNINGRYGKDWKPQTVSTYLTKLCLKDYIVMKRAGRSVTYGVLIKEEEYQCEQAREFVSFWDNEALEKFMEVYYYDTPPTKEEITRLQEKLDLLKERCGENKMQS